MPQEVDIKFLSQKSSEEIFKSLKTSKNGLAPAEAAKRLKFFGPNEIGTKRRLTPLLIFISKFRNPLLLLLISAAIISGFLGSVLDSVVIIFIVGSSAILDFLNTYRSAKAALKLQEKVNITAAVWRGGELKERKIQEVVPGDVFSLAAGDTVPADSILIEGRDIFVNESSLTGESLPAEKNPAGGEVSTPLETTRARSVPLSLTGSTLWMGTSVVSGRGSGVAVATGPQTKFGRIGERLREPAVSTEFDKNIKTFSFFIFRITIFLVLAILLINLFFSRKPPVEIFLFAVAIAVGITPELLPLIITSNLAKGALAMSRGGVIVKKLSAIHNFGGIDVLCTDKTGTLTEDRITLMKYVDATGKENERVLFWGYLGSTHITGVRSALDRAVQEFKKLDVSEWQKVDELPFDSLRRRDSVAVRHGKEFMLVVKGAPEEILKVSRFYGEEHHALDRKLLEKINVVYENLSSDGFRVLGVGFKKLSEKRTYSEEDESDLAFLGFLAFLDPPKKGVKTILEKLTAYNIDIKIITGDNRLVTEKVAREIKFQVKGHLTGEEAAELSNVELRSRVEEVNVFTRVAPEQKELIIRALRENGHVVGYLGDGVNDVLSLKEADVGISVNNAVDIAKDTADIILLKKGLQEIIEGVIEGRKTFANTLKYLMMALSSNFGNMFSMPIASTFLNFLPMTPSQILLNNFLYDSSQFTIPFDNVDEQFLKRPKRFDVGFMKRFMITFGPLSSLFDLATFFVLFYGLGLSGAGFQTGWFLESIATQTLVVIIVRSRESALKSRPGTLLVASSLFVVFFAWILPTVALGRIFGLVRLSSSVLVSIAAIVLAYLVSVEWAKKSFYKKYGYLIEK